MVYIVFLGAPGAGKGTQAAVVADELNLAHIATGDMFREAQKQETELATFYANRGDIPKAEEAFRRAIEEGKGSGNLHLTYMNQGIFYKEMGKTEEAERAFRNALRTKPSFTPARLELEKLLSPPRPSGQAP